MGAVLAFCAAAWGQQALPPTAGETLAGKKVSLPEAFGGKPPAVILGFTHASQKETKAWAEKLRGVGPVWSMAVLEDAPRLVRGMAVHGMKGGTPKDEYDRFVVVYKGEKELKQAAEFGPPDDAYVVVVDGSGAIRRRYHGPPTDEAVAQIREELGKSGFHARPGVGAARGGRSAQGANWF
jgi:hypothetical protein